MVALRWYLLAVALVGCHGVHGHDADDHAGDEDHHVRDPALEPCDASNWWSLFPDLRECDLAAVFLDGQSLRRANLTGANLAGASLANVDLFTASLANANVTEASLDGAKLTSVDFSNADLSGSWLRGAVLSNATLAGAVVDGATTDESTTCPTGNPGPCW